MKARKVICALLCVALIFKFPALPRADYKDNYSLADIDSHWAENEITTLTNAGIMRPSEYKSNPNASITRGEFTALIIRTLNLTTNISGVFKDIPKGHMFEKEINAAYEHGIILGVGENLFAPGRTITREEIMIIISRCTNEKGNSSITFSDISNNYKYKNELKTAIASGIITGFSDNTFRPRQNASRAEAAVMLKRLLNADDNISKEDALNLAESYIDNDINNIKENLNLSVGRANEETNLKLEAVNIINNNSIEVVKLLDNLALRSFATDGKIANATYTADITYITNSDSNSKNRIYEAQIDVDIIEKDKILFVYDYTLSLKKKERINLTWEVYSSVPDYAPEGVNVISPSSFQVSTENLGVEKRDLLGNIKFHNSLTHKYMDYAEKNGYEVWPIYKTDFTLKTSDLFLNNPSARKQSLEYLIEYACKYFIDGINFDFENVYQKNRHLLSKHVRDASVMLHELGLVISVDVTRYEATSANWSMCYDRNLLSQNADYIMLMAYDEYYASSKTVGSVASLDWTEDSVTKTLKEVPAEKLVLGIPFYMRYFELTGSKVTSSKAISMQTAYNLIQKNNPTYTYIETDRQYKISWKNGNKTCVFWLENSDTMAERVEIANKYNLAGVASWRRGLEVSKIWSVINDNLN
jgi:spore germination protein YaaH